MKVNVRVTARARVSKIIVEPNGDLRVYTNVPPTDGKANAAVIAALSDHFNVPKSQIKLIQGTTTRNKVFIVQD